MTQLSHYSLMIITIAVYNTMQDPKFVELGSDETLGSIRTVVTDAALNVVLFCDIVCGLDFLCSTCLILIIDY